MTDRTISTLFEINSTSVKTLIMGLIIEKNMPADCVSIIYDNIINNIVNNIKSVYYVSLDQALHYGASLIEIIVLHKYNKLKIYEWELDNLIADNSHPELVKYILSDKAIISETHVKNTMDHWLWTYNYHNNTEMYNFLKNLN
jgi:hypothetical protein